MPLNIIQTKVSLFINLELLHWFRCLTSKITTFSRLITSNQVTVLYRKIAFKKIDIVHQDSEKTEENCFLSFEFLGAAVWILITISQRQKSILSFSIVGWETIFRREHNACGLNKTCIVQVRQKCLQKGRRLFGSAFNQFTQCVFPIKMQNIFESKKSGKCWKIRQKRGIKQCLRRKKKKCEKRVSARHPNMSSAKIKDKCKRVRKVEKCMVVYYKFSKRVKKPWNKKLARNRCKRILKKS